VTIALDQLSSVATGLQELQTLEAQLQLLVDGAARILAVPRTGVRLLDPARRRLLAVARSGMPLHRTPVTDFAIGEGLVGWVVSQAQPVCVGNAELDPRYVGRPFMVEPLRSFVGAPLLARGTCIGALYASHRERDHFTAAHLSALTLLAGLCAPHIEAARLARLADIDALTGVLNRRGARPLLDSPERLSVVLTDVDYFKRVNDQLGHSAGDAVLSRVAALLGGVVRAGDSVVRWGGEEFLLVLPGADLEQAMHVAERARRAVSVEPFGLRCEMRITLSAGVAERRAQESAERLLRRADEGLYSAKRHGRDRACRAA
jgi:diguanylate cyclase (GGDEF)-like protein